MKPLKLLFIITLFISANSCKENSLETEPNYQPGRRDYTWTQDTIKYPCMINKFCGENVNDVWAIDMMGWGNRCILRFDGSTWTEFSGTMNEPTNNIISAIKMGVNLWFISTNGEIWQSYNNSINKEGKFYYQSDKLSLYSIAGKSINEIVSVGARGTPINIDGSILFYNGKGWIQKELLNDFGRLVKSVYSIRNDKYYFHGYKDINTITNIIYEYDREIPRVIWENNTGERCSVQEVDGYLYAVLGNTVYRYKNEMFEPQFQEKDSEFGGRVYGRNKNDLVVRMLHGIKHWNGTDLQYILRMPQNVEVGGAMLVLEKDIFIRTHDYKTNYTIIYHGTLK